MIFILDQHALPEKSTMQFQKQFLLLVATYMYHLQVPGLKHMPPSEYISYEAGCIKKHFGIKMVCLQNFMYMKLYTIYNHLNTQQGYHKINKNETT